MVPSRFGPARRQSLVCYYYSLVRGALSPSQELHCRHIGHMHLSKLLAMQTHPRRMLGKLDSEKRCHEGQA